jgi:hypothetical protein
MHDAWSLINLLAASVASRSRAFDLDRCLRKYKINNPKSAEILNERSKADDVTHAPGVATTSAGGVEHAVSHRSITKGCGSGWVK